MSGFLQRLAAQAMGIETGLRSVARLPYALPTVQFDNTDADAFITTVDLHQTQDQPISAGNTAQHPLTDPNQPPNTVKPQARAQTAEYKDLITQAEEPPRPTAAAVPTPPHTAHSDSAHLNGLHTAQNGPTSANGEPSLDVEANTNPSFSHQFTPPPLLPITTTAQPAALNPHARVQRGQLGAATTQTQIGETTEVHVSIGRIEVTAVHEAPAPKRHAPITAKPMTLEDYLARRRREA